MKKYILIAGVFTLAAFSSCRRDRGPQPGYQPRAYSFIEDFNNDQRGWSFADPDNLAYGVVSNGTFKFDYNDNYYDAYYVAQDFDFNPYDDFTVSARIGSDNNMGLLFGYNAANNAYGYSFTVDANGYFALYDEGGNGYGPDIEELVPLQTNGYVNGNQDWNEVSVEQRGSRWIGYINGYQVFNIAAQNFKGTGVGFVVVSNTQGEADYLEAYWYR